MGTPGHSETEKIKILYADSLKDIRDLTTRLEEVASKVHASSETAHEVEILAKSAISEAYETFKGLADKEMKRAGEAAISALSGQVGRIAQTVAGDSAAVERHNSLVKASVFASIGVIFCAFIFGGGGFLFAKSLSSSRVTSAERELVQANFQLENEKKRVDEKIVELEEKSVGLEKKSEDEIAKIRAASGWAGTPTGRLAKKFFDLGTGNQAATCNSDTWEIVEDKNKSKWCIPKRRDLIGGDQQPGWKIP